MINSTSGPIAKVGAAFGPIKGICLREIYHILASGIRLIGLASKPARSYVLQVESLEYSRHTSIVSSFTPACRKMEVVRHRVFRDAIYRRMETRDEVPISSWWALIVHPRRTSQRATHGEWR